MPLPVPQPGDKQIPSEFLEELQDRTFRPIWGPGVSDTKYGLSILPSAPSGGGGKSVTIRYGLLRSTLNMGMSCIIEERTWQGKGSGKDLKCTGKTYRAFDPLLEFTGIKNTSCVMWFVDPNGPDKTALDALGITLPSDVNGGDPTETDIATIQRITCPDFSCICDVKTGV